MDINLSESAGIPVRWTIVDKNKVKKVKLPTKPATMPNGLLLPPPTVVERIIGRRGRMHGERTVIIPPRKAKMMRISMLDYSGQDFVEAAAVPAL